MATELLCFEDMYPALGDYDFNDFVAWYNFPNSTVFIGVTINVMQNT